MTVPLVLASGSSVRRRMLTMAGLTFDIDPADLDEDAVQVDEPLERAMTLAQAKAEAVSARHPGTLVLGADQVGQVQGHWLDKCWTEEDARAQLLRMRGTEHRFWSAAALVRDGDVVWEGHETAAVTFDAFSDQTLDGVLGSEEWRGSCGSYQIENRGAQLVRTVDGPLSAVWGMPLFGLLAALRAAGAL